MNKQIILNVSTYIGLFFSMITFHEILHATTAMFFGCKVYGIQILFFSFGRPLNPRNLGFPSSSLILGYFTFVLPKELWKDIIIAMIPAILPPLFALSTGRRFMWFGLILSHSDAIILLELIK